MNIGIIVPSIGKKSPVLEKAIIEKGHKAFYYPINNISLIISSSTSGYDSACWLSDGKKIVMPDVFIWRAGGVGKNGMHFLRFLNQKGIACTHTPSMIQNCSDKFRTHRLLSMHKGIRNPKTVLCPNLEYFQTAVKKIGKYPVIAKTLTGSQGIGVAVIPDKKNMEMYIKLVKSEGGKTLLFQEFVKTGDGENVEDYRIFVVYGKIISIMKRQSLDGKQIANISQGAKGMEGTLNEVNKTMALDAVAAMGMISSVCGVDMLIDSNGKGYLCECNSNPGFKIQTFTKKNVVAPIVDLAVKLANMDKEELKNRFSRNSEDVFFNTGKWEKIESYKKTIPGYIKGATLGIDKLANSILSKKKT